MPSFQHLDDRRAAILRWRGYICFSNLAGEEAATNFVEGIPDGGVLLSSNFSHGRLKALSDCLGGPTMLRTHHRSGYARSAGTSPYLCGCAHGRGLAIYDILGPGSSANDDIVLARHIQPVYSLLKHRGFPVVIIGGWAVDGVAEQVIQRKWQLAGVALALAGELESSARAAGHSRRRRRRCRRRRCRGGLGRRRGHRSWRRRGSWDGAWARYLRRCRAL